MRRDDLNRILSEEEILPSSGFAASVMDAVRREASAPPPIPFPWKRAVPGMVVGGLVLVLVVVVGIAQLGRGAPASHLPTTWSSTLGPVLKAVMSAGAGWIALALLLTLVSVVLSTRLASGRV